MSKVIPLSDWSALHLAMYDENVQDGIGWDSWEGKGRGGKEGRHIEGKEGGRMGVKMSLWFCLVLSWLDWTWLH